jgi:hypothetical protein
MLHLVANFLSLLLSDYIFSFLRISLALDLDSVFNWSFGDYGRVPNRLLVVSDNL